MIFFKKVLKINKKKNKTNIKRGEYISKIAHCDVCHTKNNILGKINKYFKYFGETLIDKIKVTKIINNKKEGIKKKHTNEIYKILKLGISKEKKNKLQNVRNSE